MFKAGLEAELHRRGLRSEGQQAGVGDSGDSAAEGMAETGAPECPVTRPCPGGPGASVQAASPTTPASLPACLNMHCETCSCRHSWHTFTWFSVCTALDTTVRDTGWGTACPVPLESSQAADG